MHVVTRRILWNCCSYDGNIVVFVRNAKKCLYLASQYIIFPHRSELRPIVVECNRQTGEKHDPTPEIQTRDLSCVRSNLACYRVLCFRNHILQFRQRQFELSRIPFNAQMVAILLKSFTINATHVVAYLQNAGTKIIEITNAYVNGLIASLTAIVQVVPNALGAAILQGNFQPGNTYSIKLSTIFNTEITFQASF